MEIISELKEKKISNIPERVLPLEGTRNCEFKKEIDFRITKGRRQRRNFNEYLTFKAHVESCRKKAI